MEEKIDFMIKNTSFVRDFGEWLGGTNYSDTRNIIKKYGLELDADKIDKLLFELFLNIDEEPKTQEIYISLTEEEAKGVCLWLDNLSGEDIEYIIKGHNRNMLAYNIISIIFGATEIVYSIEEYLGNIKNQEMVEIKEDNTEVEQDNIVILNLRDAKMIKEWLLAIESEDVENIIDKYSLDLDTTETFDNIDSFYWKLREVIEFIEGGVYNALTGVKLEVEYNVALLLKEWLEEQWEEDTEEIIDKYVLVLDMEETEEALQRLYNQLDNIVERRDSNKTKLNNSVKCTCWFCGGEMRRNGDFSYEDYGMEGDGVIANLTCSNCGATAEFSLGDEE